MVVATVEAEIPIYRLKEFGFIHDLWVEPDYRNPDAGDRPSRRMRHEQVLEPFVRAATELLISEKLNGRFE